jgi:hypothetical protein
MKIELTEKEALEFIRFKLKQVKKLEKKQIKIAIFNEAQDFAKKEGLELGMKIAPEVIRAWNDKHLWTKSYLIEGKHYDYIHNFGINDEYEDGHVEYYFNYDGKAFPIEGFGEFYKGYINTLKL